MSTAAAPRRIGTEDSTTRVQLLDAAEALLVEEGYAAVTSRKVAAKAGLKPQLVHYYFRSMDDLFLAVFRRRGDENLARFERVRAAGSSLRALWDLSADTRGAAFMFEFVALANHRKEIGSEIAAYAERFRLAQLEAVQAALAAKGITEDQLPPIVAVFLMTGINQMLAIEQSLGVTSGHSTTVAFIEEALAALDSRPPRR